MVRSTAHAQFIHMVYFRLCISGSWLCGKIENRPA